MIKILDMGLARFTSETAEAGHLTQTGQVMGTPDYIALEQALDTKHADIRSDIYSLGCTLFRLLAGRVPFRGHNAVARIMARLNQDAPPLRGLRPDLPAELCALVQKTLSRDPAELAEPRVKATATLRNDLLDFRRRHYAFPDVAIPAARLMSRLPWPVDHLQREKIDPYELKIAGQVSRGASAPGSTPARSRGAARNPPLPELVAVLGDARLKHWEPVALVAFSPDGKTLASGSSDKTVKLWDVVTGEERVKSSPELTCVAASPDGDVLATGASDGSIRFWDLSTGRELRTLRQHTMPVRSLAFSSDGLKLASGSDDKTAFICSHSAPTGRP